ncbi:hypothetical protein L6164_037449 [Bauhinia variegata]|uniref:Uncharacterized protein n=1 Tax=Bauhinia variegata TaxID=167791 RepID=A0ACB9KK46_BAUVA|nr:hypothetical protein L6164_037449 [Bauhinia variegata]
MALLASDLVAFASGNLHSDLMLLVTIQPTIGNLGIQGRCERDSDCRLDFAEYGQGGDVTIAINSSSNRFLGYHDKASWFLAFGGKFSQKNFNPRPEYTRFAAANQVHLDDTASEECKNDSSQDLPEPIQHLANMAGATDHFICTPHLFSTSTPVTNSYVQLPNGTKAQVTHIGQVRLLHHITLHNVLLVPSFSYNLLSASKLTNSGAMALVVLRNLCFIQDLSK